jgi:hypothetical protein
VNLHDILPALRRASALTHRSVPSLAAEMMQLRFGRGRLGATEYLSFRLYEPERAGIDKKAFGGYRMMQVLVDILVDDRSSIVAQDKVCTYAVLTALGFPIPRIQAVYGSGRRVGAFRCIETQDELIAHLKAPGSVPAYLKPAWGSYGRGNTVVKGYREGALVLGDGSTVEATSFCRSLDSASFSFSSQTGAQGRDERRPFGWILQEVLSAHRDIADVCGDKISGVRVHTFLSPRGPRIHRAIWKINVGTKDSDNFHHGASGNMLAALNPEDGSAVRVVAGVGMDQKINPVHPRTGRELVGFRLPEWKRIREVVLDASSNFPGLLCQGWDVAVCDDGPRLLEVNPIGDLDLSQHSHARGFVDDQFLALMRERGLEDLLYGGNAIWRKSPRTGRWGRRKLHWAW